MTDFRFRWNPRGSELAGCSAVLNGRSRQYEIQNYRTTLSIKSVVHGAARYETAQGTYLVTPDRFLILNDGQRYSLGFEDRTFTETLCPFFQTSLVENATRSDWEAGDHAPPVPDFCERLYPKIGAVGRALGDLESGGRRPHVTGPWVEDRMYALAAALAELRVQVRAEADGFPGLRAGTRMEMYRRLYRGRDYLYSCFDQPLTVAAAARVAGLSPFHFQRMFKLAFGRTPMQFLQATRLETAQRMLTDSEDDITEICLAVGFESLGSFSWLFTRRFGVSPRTFRAAAKSQD